MRTVDVTLPASPSRRYQILVGVSLPGGAADELGRLAQPPRWALISDSEVASSYAEPLADALRAAGGDAECFVFPAGEQSKGRETVADLQDRLIARGCGRDSWAVAVGGGVVGDVAGFVAATLFRGIPYVQVPTTLLAMVDSSVGGKTGIDTADGKNFVGALYQPRGVLIDVAALGSLPDAEFASGLAEVIKYGVIVDAGLFDSLESNLLDACLRRENDTLEDVVARCCQLKADVVAADEPEADYRQILNFGHTVGHAIEAVLEYQLRHGEAVAIGMVAEARLASRVLGAPDEIAPRIETLCERAGLPTRLPVDCSLAGLLEAARRDKKARAGQIRCALPIELGRMATGPDGYGIPIEAADLESVLR